MTGVTRLLRDLEARGVRVKIPAANKLRLTGPRDAVEALQDEVARRKSEIISFLESQHQAKGQKGHVAPQARNVPHVPDVDQFEEIAARMEYEEGLSRDAAEDVSAMLMGFEGAAQYRGAVVEAWRCALGDASERLPARNRRIRQMVDDGLALLESWGDQAVRYGWNSCELFGVCPATFDLRIDRCGLAYFIGGGRIHSIDSNLAEIEGPVQALDHVVTTEIVRRHLRNNDGGAVPVWDYRPGVK